MVVVPPIAIPKSCILAPYSIKIRDRVGEPALKVMTAIKTPG
jgi:hypothetical protein